MQFVLFCNSATLHSRTSLILNLLENLKRLSHAFTNIVQYFRIVGCGLKASIYPASISLYITWLLYGLLVHQMASALPSQRQNTSRQSNSHGNIRTTSKLLVRCS